MGVAEMDHELIDARIEVKRMIENGDIEDAIKKVNSINPEILETNPELFFEMKRQ
jgi:glucose-induced degradation protein 8